MIGFKVLEEYNRASPGVYRRAYSLLASAFTISSLLVVGNGVKGGQMIGRVFSGGVDLDE